MGVLLWFAPWAVYWVLVGNAPLLVAAVAALLVAAAVMLCTPPSPVRMLEIGAVATFTVLALLPLAVHGAQQWVLALSFAALLAVVLIGMVLGKSVVAAVVKADLPAAVLQTDLFAPAVNRLTSVWVGALAAMTVSAAVPPLALADASVHHTGAALNYLCYWVIPFGILAAAAIASRVLPARMTAGFDDVARKTSFLAFVDMEIDQLYYLATEHANREVGPGQQVYNVTVGAQGTPLLSDPTRMSWPSTYKVRQLRS